MPASKACPREGGGPIPSPDRKGGDRKQGFCSLFHTFDAGIKAGWDEQYMLKVLKIWLSSNKVGEFMCHKFVSILDLTL